MPASRSTNLPRLLTCLALIGWAGSARAASPSVPSIRPIGGQRGTDVEVNFHGVRLADAKDVFLYQPGIVVDKLTVVNDTHVKATFHIAADAAPGIRDVRLRTATGVSELRTFSVGLLPEVSEVEPNGDFAKPQPIPFGAVVNGIAESEDVDGFAIVAKKGDRITAEVEGIRAGITVFDSYVAIVDSRRFELAASDDASLTWLDGSASAIAPEDGTYIIQVRESAYAGNGSCLYRLHVGDFPRPRASVPGGGKAGDAVPVRWIGDARGDLATTVTLAADARGDVGAFAVDPKGQAPHPNVFRASPFGNAIEVEPNDDQPTATRFEAPLALNGAIDKPGDTDHFVFAAKKGQAFDVNVYARTLRSPLDPVLYIAKKGAGAFAGNDDTGGPDSYIRFAAPDDGDYVISVVDHLRKGGPDYAYRIEVAPVAAKLVLSTPIESLPKGAGTVASAVPRGGRQAILINATRTDFAGDLILSAENLPPGVAFEVDTIVAGASAGPLLLKAAADAPLGGSLARIKGKHADPAVAIPSEFVQTNELVIYPTGQTPYWVRRVDSLAVAVTDEAPFSIEVVEPKAPLVRGGSMALRVVATRKPDFKAAIAVALPWNPPGVSSSAGVVIPEGQAEAAIAVNANNEAEIRAWKVVVNGTAATATGPLMVSSQLAKLVVAPRFVDFAYQPASVEQGKEVELVVKVAKAVDFEGEAVATLIGLPNKATTEPLKLTKTTAELIFKIKTDPATPAGNHQNLFCQVSVPANGEQSLHNLGSGTLRVDVPLPPKVAPPAPAPVAAAPTPAPAAPAPPPEKRLTRLEKLRNDHQERAKAANAAPASAPTAPPAAAAPPATP